MFTGIIQGLGKVIESNDSDYTIATNLNLDDCKIGSSICCDGVCLTITNIKKDINNYVFKINIGEETRNRTNFGISQLNYHSINLEKSLKFGEEISGHYVYGHIDSTSKILQINKLKNSWELILEKNFNSNNIFIVEKGSISVNGVSLTIASVTNHNFLISIIPYTFNNTNLQFAKENDFVNIEFDYLARFVLNKNNE